MKINYIRSLSMVLINVLTLFIIMLAWGKKLETVSMVQWGFLVTVGALIQTIIIFLFYKFVDKKPFNPIIFRMNKKDVLFSFVSIIATALLFMFYLLFAARVDHFSVRWNFEQFSSLSFYLVLLWVGFAWFNAAFTEEVLFRWYLVTNLKHLSTVKIYIGTCIFFMISHVFKGLDPFYMLFLLITSCCLLYVFLRTGGKLLPVTFAHLAQNLAINHLVGKSNIAILQFDVDPGIIHFIVLTVLYNVLIVVLASVMYKREEGIQFRAEPNAQLL